MKATEKVRLAYAGTPDFSAVILKAILQAGFDVSFVLTQTDRKAGRGMKLRVNPVKKIALEYGIPLFQPSSLNLQGKDHEIALDVHDRLVALKCDVLMVAAYGILLPSSLLSLPTYGCVNVHASLLPRWRGASPIQKAIQAGDYSTGITMMLMDMGLDTGPIISQAALPISNTDTAGSLHMKLALLGAKCSIELLKNLSFGNRPVVVEQSNEKATYAPKLTKYSSCIDWRKSVCEIERFVRSLDPNPGAITWFDDCMIKIWSVEFLDCSLSKIYQPGQIVKLNSKNLIVAAGDGFLRILELQRSGGKRLKVEDFLSGLFLFEEGKYFHLPD